MGGTLGICVYSALDIILRFLTSRSDPSRNQKLTVTVEGPEREEKTNKPPAGQVNI